MSISIINDATKSQKARIILLLELGWSRTQIAEIGTLGKYGAIQNVYAAWSASRNGNVVSTRAAFTRTFTPTLFNRRFGVEIEAFGVDKSAMINALNEAGITAAEGWRSQQLPTWKVTGDSSINGAKGFEIVSPILQGEDGLQQLKTVCAVLAAKNAKINKSCGMHIHFDAAGFELNQWKNIYKNYNVLEPIIDGFMPASRRANGNYYCRSNSVTDFKTKIDAAQDLEGISNIFRKERYFKINPVSYLAHNTIEFRQHSGTIEFEKIQNWVYFLHNLVAYSAVKCLENATFETLKKFNQPTVVNFYYHRTNDLAA